jgi:hypothetical protein
MATLIDNTKSLIKSIEHDGCCSNWKETITVLNELISEVERLQTASNCKNVESLFNWIPIKNVPQTQILYYSKVVRQEENSLQLGFIVNLRLVGTG